MPGGRQTRMALESPQTEEHKKWTLQADSHKILSKMKTAMASRIPNGLKGVTSEKLLCKALGKCSRKKWEWDGKTSEIERNRAIFGSFHEKQ